MGSYAIDWHNSLLQSSRCDGGGVAIDGSCESSAAPDEVAPQMYRVRKRCEAGEFATVTQALAQWNSDKASAIGLRDAVIEIADNSTYHEAPALIVAPHESLHLRAAQRCRPVLRMSDYQGAEHETIAIRAGAGSRVTLEGLMVAGGPLALHGQAGETPCAVSLRDCTLVPGWDTEGPRRAAWRSPPSIIGDASGVHLGIYHSVVGSLQFSGTGNTLHIRDSIVDAGHAAALAVSDHAHGPALVRATIIGTRIVGMVQARMLDLAEDSIFHGALLVERRDSGCIRRCYLAPGSRTPRRDKCQAAPALPEGAAEIEGPCLPLHQASLRWRPFAGVGDEGGKRWYRAVRSAPMVMRTSAAELHARHAGMRSASVRLDRSERVDQVLA